MLVALKTLTQWPETSRSSFPIFLQFNFNLHTINLHCFYHHLKIQTKFTILDFTSNRLYEENPSLCLCSTLELLYCNSFATAVGPLGYKFCRFRYTYCGTYREVIEQAIRLNFYASNNKAEYEAIIIGLDLAISVPQKKSS